MLRCCARWSFCSKRGEAPIKCVRGGFDGSLRVPYG